MGLFGTLKQQTGQTLFRDDMKFQFRQVPIDEGNQVEQNSSGVAINAWMMKYKLQKEFAGYKNIPPGKYTPAFQRDIILDIFNQLGEREKPAKGKSLVKDFVQRIAEAKCYKHEQSAKSSLFMDKMVVFMGVVAVLLAIAICLGLLAK